MGKIRSTTLKILNKLVGFLASESNTRKFYFTNQIEHLKDYSIGNYTYGEPVVLFPNDNATLVIGKFCSIAKDVTIFLGGNHRVDWVSTYPFFEIFDDFEKDEIIEGHPSTKGSVVIGNDVWIGRNVIILSGVQIGNGAVIAAGSVITKNIGSYEVWAGNPAKMVKKRFDIDTIETMEKIRWWDWDLEKIKHNIKYLCTNNIKQILLYNESK